jgi:chromosome segregation ATPase
MNKALKIEEFEGNSIALDGSGTLHAPELSDLNTDEIRAKIKAARLEKLMARQLENELTIELENDQDTPLLQEVSTQTLESEEVEILTTEPSRIDIPASKTKGYSLGSSKRMRNMQSSKHSCDEMLNRLKSGSELLSGLNEQTSNLVSQLQFMEQEFIRFEEAEIKSSKLAADYKRVTSEYEEALNLIEKQNRQIDVIEERRARTSENYEKIKSELDLLKIQNKQETELNTENQLLISELEQTNRSLSNRTEAAETSLSETTSELKTINSLLKQKDMEAARAQSDLVSTKERLMNAETGLSASSEEYDQLSRQYTEKEIKLQTLETKLEGSNEKLSALEVALKHTTSELENMTAEAHDNKMSLAKLTSDYGSLIKANSKTMNELDNIQTKYDELNKSSLEQQSQQYARIHELESVLRDTKRKLEASTKSNSELSLELESTNNLLVLHEEMVTALSAENRN